MEVSPYGSRSTLIGFPSLLKCVFFQSEQHFSLLTAKAIEHILHVGSCAA
jgi:hypothetical protein